MPEETAPATDTPVETPDPTPEEIIPADDLLGGVGEFEDDTPAETPEAEVEAPAETAEETPAEATDETATNVAKTPVATPETPKAPAANEPTPAQPVVDPRIQAYADWARDNAELIARAGELDPIDHADEFKKAQRVMFQGQQLLAARQDAVLEMQQAHDAWQAWHSDNTDIPLGKARAMFSQAVAETRAELPDAGPQSIQRVATKMFAERLKAMRAEKAPPAKPVPPPAPAKPAAPVVKKPPVTPGGAKILPKTAATTKPGVPSKTAEDYLAANSSGFRDFLG